MSVSGIAGCLWDVKKGLFSSLADAGLKSCAVFEDMSLLRSDVAAVCQGYNNCAATGDQIQDTV